MAKEQVENEKLVAILSYFFVGMIWYLADEKVKKSGFAKFHFKQALILLIVSVALSILSSILALVTLGMFGFIAWIINIIILVLWIIGVINAANMKEKELPVIGGFAKKLKF